MLKIAVTGNIASGKSEAERVLKGLGFKVLCTDEVSHELLEENTAVQREVLELFGTLDRRDIGKAVFAEPKLRTALEGVIHPQVKIEIERFFKENTGEKAVFVSVPLLYEAKMERLFDKVILVCASEDVRLSRLLKRNGFAHEDARSRILAQMDEAKKRALADIIIENNGDLNALETSVKAALKLLL
jgi:dephospho-CoA kinase